MLKRSYPMNSAWILCLLLNAGDAPQTAVPAPPAAQSDPLEARYLEVQRDFNLAMGEWQKALDAARKAGVDPKEFPRPPHAQFWERYAALTRDGHLAASIWCLSAGTNLGEARAPDAAIIDLALERVWKESIAIDQLIAKGELHENAPQARLGVKEYLRFLRSQTMVLGAERSLELYELCVERSVARPSKALALLSKASFIGLRSSGFVDPMPIVAEIYRELARDYADTDSGMRAAGRLFRYERLQVGMSLPERSAVDVEGVEFKLSDYQGKVLVLDFWGFW